ncbi:MAG: 6-carboxy-5,6,7,8-tetrahydropterin synthase [Alphaproteobacteria bacterium]|nr:6-carboxy-5,6,7,8-tetrahydropterin synthase [Alphaproteobacteria bacterium]
MPTITCTRLIAWDALHRIPGHEGICRAFHGHRYSAEITCAADALDGVGRVVDFSVIKKKVGGWIDTNWDHTAILMRGDPDPAVKAVCESNASYGRPVYMMDVPPTAENIAAELFRIASDLLREDGVSVQRIRVWETPNCYADVVG